MGGEQKIEIMRWCNLLLITLVALCVSGCSNRADEPTLSPTLPVATLTIAQLHDYASTVGAVTIDHDAIIHGRVTSSDEASNFYRSLTVEDDTGGVEVLIARYNLHTHYPEGLKVALRLSGCAMGYEYGVLQLGQRGVTPEEYDVEYIESPELIDRVVVRSDDIAPRIAQRRHITELNEATCGMFVRIDSLQLVGSTSIDTLLNQGLDMATWRGHSMFVDNNNDTLVVYTRDGATYASRPIPTSELSLQGIVYYAKHPNNRNYYQLKMRHESDCVAY